jgi:hypothetical protein
MIRKDLRQPGGNSKVVKMNPGNFLATKRERRSLELFVALSWLVVDLIPRRIRGDNAILKT